MFGIWKKKKPVVLKHWFLPLLDFETSVDDFYRAIEKELEERQLSGLEISRVEYFEGGLLSPKREYLRMRRERLLFDVCAAPFGKAWFFSCRFSEIPFSLRIWEMLVIVAGFASMAGLYLLAFGWPVGLILFIASFAGFLLLLGHGGKLGLRNLDADLLPIPVIGALYEILFRRETYFREDTRQAYITFVDEVIRAKIDETTGARGIKLLKYEDLTPPSAPAVLSMASNLIRASLR